MTVEKIDVEKMKQNVSKKKKSNKKRKKEKKESM